MLKKIALIVLFMGLANVSLAAENLFEKNYAPQKNLGFQSLQAVPETKMFVSNHKTDDNISMLENGYDMMGSSDFEAGDVSPNDALVFAKSIKADTVLVYTKYSSKPSPISKITAIKEAAKTTGEVDESVLKQDEEQFKYYASYWAKLPPPLLGVHVIKLKPIDKEVKPEDGLKIIAVIKESPAAKANIQRDDVLLKIGDIVLEKPEQLSIAAKKYQGQEVNIDFMREGESLTTSATLNRLH